MDVGFFPEFVQLTFCKSLYFVYKCSLYICESHSLLLGRSKKELQIKETVSSLVLQQEHFPLEAFSEREVRWI